MMGVSAIANATNVFSTAQVGEAVPVTVLKKAQDAEAQVAVDLINAVPPPAKQPDHLGQNVNTTA